MTSRGIDRRRGRSLLVLVLGGVLGLVLMTACSGDVSIGNRITKADGAEIGHCLKIGDKAKDGKVEVEKADCNADELVFGIASKVPSTQSCASDYYSHLTFGGSSDMVCLVPNFAQGKCYQIPGSTVGNLADYRQIGCDATPKEGTVRYRVTARGDGPQKCDSSQLEVNYEQPKPRGYCLEKTGQT